MTDREIIEAIATKVMGWEFIEGNKALMTLDKWGTNVGSVFYDDWNPLERIADAWMVVEKIRGRGYQGLVVSGPATPATKNSWGAAFGNEPQESPIMTWADTAHRAICLAALAALSVDAGKEAGG